MIRTQRVRERERAIVLFVDILIACCSFESWSDFFGPVQVPSVDGDFTEITVSNYNDPNQTQPIDLTRPLGSRQQVFDAENIVLL